MVGRNRNTITAINKSSSDPSQLVIFRWFPEPKSPSFTSFISFSSFISFDSSNLFPSILFMVFVQFICFSNLLSVTYFLTHSLSRSFIHLFKAPLNLLLTQRVIHLLKQYAVQHSGKMR